MEQRIFRKKHILFPVITGIVLVAIIPIGYLSFSSRSIVGDWELIVNPELTRETLDEPNDTERVFYSFGKPSEYGDGVYKTFLGGGVEEGEYKLSEKMVMNS